MFHLNSPYFFYTSSNGNLDVEPMQGCLYALSNTAHMITESDEGFVNRVWEIRESLIHHSRNTLHLLMPRGLVRFAQAGVLVLATGDTQGVIGRVLCGPLFLQLTSGFTYRYVVADLPRSGYNHAGPAKDLFGYGCIRCRVNCHGEGRESPRGPKPGIKGSDTRKLDRLSHWCIMRRNSYA